VPDRRWRGAIVVLLAAKHLDFYGLYAFHFILRILPTSLSYELREEVG
jgi:hypothetical protein